MKGPGVGVTRTISLISRKALNWPVSLAFEYCWDSNTDPPGII